MNDDEILESRLPINPMRIQAWDAGHTDLDDIAREGPDRTNGAVAAQLREIPGSGGKWRRITHEKNQRSANRNRTKRA